MWDIFPGILKALSAKGRRNTEEKNIAPYKFGAMFFYKITNLQFERTFIHIQKNPWDI